MNFLLGCHLFRGLYQFQGGYQLGGCQSLARISVACRDFEFFTAWGCPKKLHGCHYYWDGGRTKVIISIGFSQFMDWLGRFQQVEDVSVIYFECSPVPQCYSNIHLYFPLHLWPRIKSRGWTFLQKVSTSPSIHFQLIPTSLEPTWTGRPCVCFCAPSPLHPSPPKNCARQMCSTPLKRKLAP